MAIAFVRGDAAAAAKALREFGKDNPALILKGGLLGTRVITPGDLDALADLPSREAMLAQVAGVFQAPLTKAAGLFQAFTRNFAYGVKALIDQRVEGGEALPTASEKLPSRKRRDREESADEAARGEGERPLRRRGARGDAPAEDAPAAEAPAEDAPAADAPESESVSESE